MREFTSADGRSWRVRVYDGPDDLRPRPAGVGWEALLFEDAADPAAQRLAYRPAGWLAAATPHELRAALDESEAVRARWGAERQQAGG